jgi:DNA-binding transcriptional LysR family regulator
LDWNDLKMFLALVRHGSVRSAAETLKTSHSTVARRIDALELALGAKLFDRKSTGFSLTQAGEEILASAESVEDALTGIERRVLGRDQRLEGRIRLTSADFLATHLLMPHLADFADRYPGIDLEVVTSYRTLDLDRREADVALRFTRDPPENLVGRKVATLGQAAYASPEYLARHRLAEASEARWIGFNGHARYPKWVRESPFPHLAARGNFESLLLQAEAAKNCMGIAMLPCLIGDSDPGLQRVPGSDPRPAHELWLLTHKEVRTSARLRVFTQFLGAAIAGEQARLEGR